MTQNIVNYANNPTGPELLDDYLAKEQQNNLTSNSGIQRPSYVQAGTKWLDTSSTPWVWKMFDGRSDVILGRINPSEHAFSAAGLDTAVLLTGDQTVGGVKTFSNNPLVPNVTTGDNSSKVANTAFVAAGLATKQNTLVAGRNIVISGNEISSTADSRNIGEIITSTIPLTDAGLHLLDGSVILGSGVYGDFVDYIAGLYDSGDYDDIFETEANWQTSVTTYGVCGKFVYDSINNTVRLPKITGSTESTIDVTKVGDLVEAGLPNITGQFSYTRFGGDGIANGAFESSSEGTAPYAGGGGTPNTARLGDFDASRSSSIYGNSITVQPQAIKVLYYIVVANSTKIEIEVDIDEVVSDLNTLSSNVSSLSTSLNNKIQEVSEPPVSYESGVLYVIPES